MAEKEKPSKNPLPFSNETENEWQDELADWDAHLPIEEQPAASGSAPSAPAKTSDPLEVTDVSGAVPIEENAFAETPTTVVTKPPLDDAAAFEAAAEEFSARATPHSDAYAAIISTASTVDSGAGGDSIFQRDPAIDPPAPIFADPLPEMAADAWREGVARLVRVPARTTPAELSDEEQRATLALLATEMEGADTAAQQAALTMAAARLTERRGDAEAASALYDDALTLLPSSPVALRARLRLAERAGDAALALETVSLLAEVLDGDERDHYRALEAEWTLATGGKLDDAEAASAGGELARALLAAEIAIREQDLRRAAANLEPAVDALGAPGGIALAAAAARLGEVAGDVGGAARLRARAVAMANSMSTSAPETERATLVLGQLRDAARATPDAAVPLVDAALAALPAGDFKVACARWALALARRTGNRDRVATLLADPALGPVSPAWLRERIDVARAAGDAAAAPLGELLADARATWPAPGARAAIDLMAAELVMREGDLERALEIAAAGLEAAPGATALALVAEDVARRSTLPPQRLRALRLWARFDPARAAYAQSLVVDALTAALDDQPERPSDAEVRAALAQEVAAAPISTAFWTLAARERAAGRRAEAADALARGAAAWAASELGATLRVLADEVRAGEPAPWPRPVPGRPGARIADSPEGALTESPGEPAGLALLTLEHGKDGARLASAWAAAAAALPGSDGDRLWRLWASIWQARAGQAEAARESAFALHEATRGAAWLPARFHAQRMARTLADGSARARALVGLGVGPAASTELETADALRLAEAHEVLEEAAAAEPKLRALADGPQAADAARALARLAAAARAGGPEGPASAARARVRELVAAARAGAVADVATRLEREPPHQDVATAPSLYLAALLREHSAPAGEVAAGGVARLLAAAMAWGAAPRPADRPGLLCTWHAADTLALAAPAFEDDASASGAGALVDLADRLLLGDDPTEPPAPGSGPNGSARVPAGDARSSATLLVRAAERDAAAGALERAEEHLRAALQRDGACVPALRALRRALVARGASAEAAALCEREAEVLKVKDERIRVLMLAADLAAIATPIPEAEGAVAEVAAGDSGSTPLADISPPSASRAAEPLRRILAIDPAHLGAFERLRAILSSAEDHAALAPVLAARIAAASNPFEVAALRLARAELLAGRLGDAEGAKAELRAVLQKEPQHGKALSRLADLQYESGNYGEAAELYLKRALAERSPERLREIFLRIGRIYTRHQHDAKRAADAYKRVLQLEADNREALLALADLLVEIGENKNAIAAIERLVELLPEVDKRVPYLIKLGQLYEQAGDLRQAGARFRRAADDAPRNLQALGEMVRHFERTRDVPGRRALLDHALLLLRADVHAGKLDVDVLRAIIHVMQWRGRFAAAAAGAQLLVVASSDAADRALASDVAAAAPPRARRLSALARPDVDERTFPAGLPSGVRNIFRIVGEPLGKLVGDLKRYELSRGDRVARGQGPREITDPMAAEVGIRDLDVYVKPARAAGEPAWLAVEPGDPPALVLGAPILALGTPGIRFAGARAARLAATHLDIVLRGNPAQAGALIGGVVRQFVTDYRHPDVAEDVMASGVAVVARALSRRIRQEVMPFAIECAGTLDLAALHEAVRDGANQAALLASGSLPASLAVVLATSGRPLSLANVSAHAEARTLLDFALSDAYDELCREMESTGPA